MKLQRLATKNVQLSMNLRVNVSKQIVNRILCRAIKKTANLITLRQINT